MAITIRLTAQANGAGIDFNTYYTSYFADLTPTGWPYILGGNSTFDGDQIVLLDKQEANPRNTKAIVLDGKDFFYHFNGHDLSGRLTTVRLSTLGDSYNPADQSFKLENGHIADVSTAVEISGLNIFNAKGVEDGDFHNVVAALMGGSHDGGASDPSVLSDHVWAGAHNVIGSAGGDRYAGTGFGDVVAGNGGNDTLDGGGGADTLRGGTGNDTFYVDAAGDRVIELVGQGTDTVRSTASHTLSANVEKLILLGSANLNGTGNSSANAITGNAGANTLNGGGGADTMTGGNGNDIYVVNAAGDRVVEARSQGTDQVRASVNHALAINVEQLLLTGTAHLSGTGNALNNAITGNSGNNSLSGGAGADTILGSGGADTIYGAAGADQLGGGFGADVFRYRSVTESTVTAEGRDLITDFKADDTLDLSAMDANSKRAGNQAFRFIDDDAFSSAAGELRFNSTASATYVTGDVNGDGTADFSIRLAGSIALTAGDFIL